MSDKSSPNVIWIFGDQHRAQALSCNGDSNLNTPNIDLLARNGVNFTGAVAGYPLCCPFRGSLLSGKYPHKCVPGHEYQLDPEEPTIATVFNNHGYDTAYFGKWHLDGFHESEGRAARHVIPRSRRGDFQKWIGYENNNSQWDTWVHGENNDEPYQLPGYETDEITNLLLGYIEDKEAEEKPFFAVMSVQPPHNPYTAPEEYMKKHNPEDIKLRPNVAEVESIKAQARRDLAGYYAQIENLDWNIGRIKKKLREKELADNTHIVFFSDHGDMHGSHGQFKKTTAYEESIRIPFIIGGEQARYEGRKTGRISNVPLNHVDIAPTTLGLCGIEKPEWMEGTDYSHYRLDWSEPDEEPDSAYIQSVIPTMHGDSVNRPWRGIVTKDGWKYVCFEESSWLLFNLNEDPYEQANLAFNSKYKKKREILKSKLKDWIIETGDEFRLPE